jgi:hypothetical protein
MTAWSAWYDDVLPEVPGALQALAEYHIKRAVIEFCTKARCYRKDAAVDDAGGSALRTFPTSLVPSGTRPVAIMRAKWAGKDLEIVSREVLDEQYGSQVWTSLSGLAPRFLLRDRVSVQGGGFSLVPYPTAATTGSLWMTVALRPTEAATTVDDSVYEEFRDSIAAGAKARLMAMPKKPWSDPALAGFYGSEFRRAIDVAKIKADRGADRQRLATRPVYY